MAQLEPEPTKTPELEIFVVLLGDSPVSMKMFPVKGAASDSVGEWRNRVYNKALNRLKGYDENDLILWKLNKAIPSDQVDTDVAALAASQNLSEVAVKMLPTDELSDHFSETLPRKSLHVIVELPSQPPINERKRKSEAPQTDDVASKRRRILEAPSQPPSHVAIPSVYHKLDKENFAYNRPPSPQIIPLALLHEIFGQFTQNVQNYSPTKEDNALVNHLRLVMSAKYTTEADLCEAFRQTLREHYKEIQLEAATIGSKLYQSDGHARIGEFVASVAEGKLLGKTSGDPEVQACTYFVEFVRGIYKQQGEFSDLFPCLIIYFTGPLIGFAGAAITDRVQLEVLTPSYPLHANPHESIFADQAVRAFGAYRQAFQQLKIHYERLGLMEPNSESVEKVVFPYRDHYTRDDETSVSFTYERRLYGEKLVFIAKTNTGDKIIVKFTRRYSVVVHQHCSDNGIAPHFRAMNELPGGWLMVVMDFLDTPYELAVKGLNGELGVALRQAVGILHNGGFVHGDIRNCNLMVSREMEPSVMILDFDWAGVAGEARYPANVNTVTVERPDGATDGELISKEHDLFMVNQILARQAV